MNTTQETFTNPPHLRQGVRAAVLALVAVVTLSFASVVEVSAQQKYSKSFPARKNVRLHLNNWSGAVTVEGWARDEVKITARMESPAARFTPIVNDVSIQIDVVSDNRGRSDVGSVNFDIKVPFSSTVDLETRRGDITVTNVQGELVRAHITSEGDISLTGIRANSVMAENVMGDILFDGELLSGGSYRLDSTQGNINVRIPANSTFRLSATAPMTRSIELGSFAGSGLNYVNERRKVVGNVGTGSASLTVINQRGTIAFIRR